MNVVSIGNKTLIKGVGNDGEHKIKIQLNQNLHKNEKILPIILFQVVH